MFRSSILKWQPFCAGTSHSFFHGSKAMCFFIYRTNTGAFQVFAHNNCLEQAWPLISSVTFQKTFLTHIACACLCIVLGLFLKLLWTSTITYSKTDLQRSSNGLRWLELSRATEFVELQLVIQSAEAAPRCVAALTRDHLSWMEMWHRSEVVYRRLSPYQPVEYCLLSTLVSSMISPCQLVCYLYPLSGSC